MARESEKSFPFDSEVVNGKEDRTYPADEFAAYFRSFISSGIFMKESTNLQVVTNGDMSVTLHPGKMIIDGYGYRNVEDIIINLDPADGVLDRIDRISITWSKADRDIHCTVQSSTYSYEPIEPECRRTAEYMDYVVADIRVKAGCVSISQEDITDQRLNSDVCGLAMPFAEIDTSEINKKLEAYYERVMKENDSWRQDEQELFDDWFATLQDKLSGDVAANLQLQIDELNDFVDHGSLYSANTETFKDLESGFYRLRNYKSDLFPGSVAVTGTMQKNVVGGHHTGTIITTDGVNYTRFADYDSSGTLVSDTGWKKMSVDTLTTMEQVEASTDLSKPVGAGAVQELNSSLTNENSETFNFGVLNGVRGFFTNPSRADDSFIPFSGIEEIFFNTSILEQFDKSMSLKKGVTYELYIHTACNGNDSNNVVVSKTSGAVNIVEEILNKNGQSGFSTCTAKYTLNNITEDSIINARVVHTSASLVKVNAFAILLKA